MKLFSWEIKIYSGACFYTDLGGKHFNEWLFQGFYSIGYCKRQVWAWRRNALSNAGSFDVQYLWLDLLIVPAWL